MLAVFNRRCSISDLEPLITVFKSGISADAGEAMPLAHYQRMLREVDGLKDAIGQLGALGNQAEQAAAVEFILEGLHLNKRLNRDVVSNQTRYRG